MHQPDPDKLVTYIFALSNAGITGEKTIIEKLQAEFNLSEDHAASVLELTQTGLFRAQMIAKGNSYPENNLTGNLIVQSALKIGLAQLGWRELYPKTTTGLIQFYPDKKLTRFEFLKRSLFIIAIAILANFLYQLKFGNRNTPTGTIIVIDILICTGLITWTLIAKSITCIQLDLSGKNFIVHFITAFTNKKVLKVPFEALTFTFEKEPSRHQPKKWTLKVYDKKKKILQIDTGQDGFSQATLKSIVEQVKNIKLF